MSAIKTNHSLEVSSVWRNKKQKLFLTPPAMDYLTEKS